MKIIYVTLDNIKEAQMIGKKLLERRLTNCVNFFPITCMYNWENELTEEPEVVLIIKTQDNTFQEIEEIIRETIDYTNFIGQIAIDQVNSEFRSWLDEIVPSE